MECADTLRVGEYDLYYPRTRRIITVAESEVCGCNSYLTYCSHKSKLNQSVPSLNNNSNKHNVNHRLYLQSPGIRIRSLHDLTLHRLLILSLLLVLPLSVCASGINADSNEESNDVHSSTDPKNCIRLKGNTTLKCTNLTLSLHEISRYYRDLSTIVSVEIKFSNLSELNFSEFAIFPKLETISVTNCSVKKTKGSIPGTVLHLNLSSNALTDIDASVFMSKDTQSNDYSDHLANPNTTSFNLTTIDLTHNLISEFPENILHLEKLESLKIFGNPFKCEFVWETLYKWYSKYKSKNYILADADETECRVTKGHFHFSILGVLKAKQSLEESCATLNRDQCHNCTLSGLHSQLGADYPTIHTSKKGSVISISIKVDCSSMNLTEMPNIPLQTWDLNVSNNQITDLSPLKTNSNYSNLIALYADYNEIDIDTLVGAPFLNRYSILGLRHNRITSLPLSLLQKIKDIEGQGQTTLGENNIYCDCNTVRDVKPLLIMLKQRIKDFDAIYCANIKGQNGQNVPVIDLLYESLCLKDTTVANELWLYVLITMEVVLICAVIAKVWHDQRTFRQTGVLPWCSAKMPRLPCDAMLEGLKDPPHHNNNYGHQPLQTSQREMRSGSSCTTKSGKSSRSSSAQSSSV